MSRSISLQLMMSGVLALAGLIGLTASANAGTDYGYGGDSVHCSIHANPGVAENGATTLIWWSSENVTEANLEGVGDVDPKSWWWTNGIEATTTYTLNVETADGHTAYCEATVEVEEEEFTHGYCKDVYPGRDIADIDNNGWGDTQHGEEGCRIAPTEEEEEETVECYDWDGDGWGWDGEKGCKIDVEEGEEESSEHGYCSDVYPGRDIADIDNNGWGDTESGEEGCRIAPEGEVEEEETVECYDWDGDGWGWDGEKGCKIDAEGEVSEEVEEEEVVEEEVVEEVATHDYCSVTYPGRIMLDANNDGWGDTESDEAGCMLDPEGEVVEEEEEVLEETLTCYDWDGDGWGWDGEKGCKIDAEGEVSEEVEEEEVVEEEVVEEVATHDYCSVTYPGRIMLDANNDGWGDTESDEAGCMLDPEGEVIEDGDDAVRSKCVDNGGLYNTLLKKCFYLSDNDEVEEDSSDHAYCSDIYPGREIADIDGNGWGDTLHGEAGCMIKSA